jgi:RAC serine/threonine-protein kinase
MFKKIKKQKLIPKVTATDALLDAEKSGWMQKQGGSYKSWKKRYCILKDGYFYYYKEKTDPNPQGVVDLRGCCCDSIQQEDGVIIRLITPIRTYLFQTVEKFDSVLDWVQVLNESSKYSLRQYHVGLNLFFYSFFS